MFNSAEISALLNTLEDLKYKIWGLQYGGSASRLCEARLGDAVDCLEGAEQALLDVLMANGT